jgi:tetratricopeptide (TPR) repeat protein/CHAT domain-containing protein
MSEGMEQIHRLMEQAARLYQEGRYEQALPVAQQTCDLTRRLAGAQHPLFATSLHNLAALYRAIGDHAAALPLYRQALEVTRAALGEAHPDFGACLNDLAGLYQAMGENAAALPLARQALEVARAALGDAHPDFATSLNNLALLYQDMGENAAALPLYRQALEVLRAALGESHPDFAAGLSNLALLHQQMGDHAAALPLFQQALEVRRAALGEDQPEFADSLSTLAALYQDMGDHAAALPLYRQALEVYQAALGETHPDFATSLSSLAILYLEMGDYGAALPLSQQALEVRRAALGEAHPDFAASLNNLATLYAHMGDQAAALPLYRQALQVRRAALGEAHPGFAIGLNNLGAVYRDMGDYRAALPLLRQALEVNRAALGEAHPDFARSLNNLAGVYRDMGDYAAALPLLRQALEVHRAALGEAHPDFAIGLNNLAQLYRDMGDYGAALPLLRQALEVRRAALGEQHPDFAFSLDHLADFYRDMGEYAAALPLLRQALEVRRAALGEQHRHYATSLNGLASLYRAMGDDAAALPLLQQALEVYRAALGDAHPDFAAGLRNLLAQLYRDMGDYGAALPLLREALEVNRAALGETHPDFAIHLNNLAQLYWEMGDYAAALPLCRQALEVRRAALGEQHPDYATSLNGLAILYQAMGDDAAALPLLQQALEVYRAALGEAHPSFANSLHNLAALYAAMVRPFEALLLMEQGAAIDTRMLGQVFFIGSLAQRTAFLGKVYVRLEVLLSLVWHCLPSSWDAVGTALSLLLRRKGIVAESLAVQRDAVLGNKYPALRARFRDWTALRAQIAQKTLAGPGPEGTKAHLEFLEQCHAKKERLEAELAGQIPEMNLEQQLRAPDRRAVALTLPGGAALVEFVRFDVVDFKAIPARGEKPWQLPRYLAFVVFSGESGRVEMLDLGEAEPIDRLIADFRAGITGEMELRDMSWEALQPTPDVDATVGERLRAAVFDPVADALGPCQRLFLAPDGDLNRLPFEALPLADGRHLLDGYRISYVSVGRDLLRFHARSGRQPAAPLVVADPDFNLGVAEDTRQPQQPRPTEGAPRRGFWGRLFGRRQAGAAQNSAPEPVVPPDPIPAAPAAGRLARDFNRSQYHFGRLPGTRVEGEGVGRRLGVPPLLADAALEGRLKACRSPRILHLATHGFFLPDQPRDLERLGRNLDLIGIGEAPAWGRLSGPGMENPMLRSGLALAGANTFLRGAALPTEAEDGLLTAEDVAGMDLLDTELVVLSACDTGLGAVHAGEGVFGLRRAFIVAGAKTLVMSLWKVPDLATAFLMDRFYDNLVSRGLDRDLALSQAQRATRDATVADLKKEWLTPSMIEQFAAGNADACRHLEQLAEQPDDHRPFAHPLYWGAFICQGDPSPLPAVTQDRPMSAQPPTGGNS